MKMNPIPILTVEETERFWSKVDRSGGADACWEWQGSTNGKTGYGKVVIRGTTLYTHRVAFAMAHGDPQGKEVCHNCPGGDNPRCCNPDHLWPGTHAENSADMVQKGRSASGEAHSQAKLAADQIQAIRESIEYQRVIAERNGVSTTTVSNIKSEKVWSHTGDVTCAVSLVCQGERSPNAKLTDQDVRDIRASDGSDRALAAYYEVHFSVINRVRRKNAWKHVI
jgi:hypothetical protein